MINLGDQSSDSQVHDITFTTMSLQVAGRKAEIAVQRRAGQGIPILHLHGFGSTKEDYADLALRAAFDGRDLIAYDAPGFGASGVDDPSALSIPFLVEVAEAVCRALGLDPVHLTGHSMGGLTGLLFALRHPDRVASFLNIEGNLAPEDCFLSRQIVTHGGGNDAEFLAAFAQRVRSRRESGSALYAASLPVKVRASSPRPIFESMVALSDSQPLADQFIGLATPRAFVHGAENRHLSYLPRLKATGVEVIEIPSSGHFPMYSNPVALWNALHDFIERAEAQA
ncbi:MAG: alpha/beta hydrolase [Alphaproteobacteria bacterium]|nr:alpha/beta hydrolase [Alphaproteobacteria bacterium]